VKIALAISGSLCAVVQHQRAKYKRRLGSVGVLRNLERDVGRTQHRKLALLPLQSICEHQHDALKLHRRSYTKRRLRVRSC